MWQSRSVVMLLWNFLFLKITMKFNLFKNHGSIIPKAKGRTGESREIPPKYKLH